MGETKHKFCVGDIIIGNRSASGRYSLTVEGVVGTVLSIDPHEYVDVEGNRITGLIKSDADIIAEFPDIDTQYGNGIYAVGSEFFDLLRSTYSEELKLDVSGFIDGF